MEAVEHVVQEEPEPDALAAAALPHPVHAVVPVAGADQRQAASAEPVQRTLQPAPAVLVQRFAQARARREVVVRLLDRKSTSLNSSQQFPTRMPFSACKKKT